MGTNPRERLAESGYRPWCSIGIWWPVFFPADKAKAMRIIPCQGCGHLPVATVAMASPVHFCPLCKGILLLPLLLLAISCGPQPPAEEKDALLQQTSLARGQEIASLTQAELLRNVATAMQEGGPKNAVAFCSVQALPIQAGLSRVHQCEIRRLALKYRNPANQPTTETERGQLLRYLSAWQRGREMPPEVHIFEDRVEYYQPITVAMETCLACHGEPDKIAPETLVVIQERYPNDLATGFALNDFRGAWKITFKR